MARARRVVPIPKPPEEAFDKNRAAGTLLRSQVAHMHHALAIHLKKVAAVLAIDPDTVRTEGDVSDYVRQVMAILHPHGGNSHRK